MPNQHDNWVERLRSEEAVRDAALSELRLVIVKGLKSALHGRAGSDQAFIEDMTQQTLVRIFEKLDTFSGRSHFTSWAMAIALRASFNELRRRHWKNVSIEELRERGDRKIEVTDERPNPAEQTQRNEIIQIIYNVIATELSQNQRDAMFAELNGMPQEEIARQLGKSRNTIYKLFHDARLAMKRRLEAKGFNAEIIGAIYTESS